jgi:hypothetical protein
MSKLKRMKMPLVASALLCLSATALAQLPPAAEVVPAGFQVTGERDLGGSKFIEATKPNENFPGGFLDQGIKLEITWMNNPAAEMIVQMLAQQPEQPAGRLAGSATREEPCGIQAYREGVLVCRKVIMPYIGSGTGVPDLVTWRIAWTGKGGNGLVSVNINNFHGAKETATAWIDAIIPKITKLD